MKILTVLFFLAIGLSGRVYADVWESSSKWTVEDEVKYQNWIENDGFNRRIFSDKNSPYYGVPTDCADVIYAARIIFSFENKLSFKIINPKRTGIFSSRYISNKGNYFNKLENEIDRVKAFISKVAVHSGTGNLALSDTYPVAIKDIKSGDIYVTKHNGIRHAYLIKKIYKSGIFDFYYSTLPRVVREIKLHRGLPLFTFSAAPWGFRRFKKSQDAGKEIEEIEGSSLGQYELLEKVGSKNILAYISKMLRVEDESIEGRVMRLVDNICRSMEDRVDAVDRGQLYVDTIAGRCVNPSEYHLYSTPGLDKRISKQIVTLKKFWTGLVQHNYSVDLESTVIEALTNLIEGQEDSRSDLCGSESISPLDPINFYFLYKDNKISPHPNDSFEARWGMNQITSNCKRYI